MTARIFPNRNRQAHAIPALINALEEMRGRAYVKLWRLAYAHATTPDDVLWESLLTELRAAGDAVSPRADRKRRK